MFKLPNSSIWYASSGNDQVLQDDNFALILWQKYLNQKSKLTHQISKRVTRRSLNVQMVAERLNSNYIVKISFTFFPSASEFDKIQTTCCKINAHFRRIRQLEARSVQTSTKWIHLTLIRIIIIFFSHHFYWDYGIKYQISYLCRVPSWFVHSSLSSWILSQFCLLIFALDRCPENRNEQYNW